MRVIVAKQEITTEAYAEPPINAVAIEGADLHFANIDLQNDGDWIKVRIGDDRCLYLIVRRVGDKLMISNCGYDLTGPNP